MSVGDLTPVVSDSGNVGEFFSMTIEERKKVMAKIETIMQERGPIAQPVWQDVITSTSKQVKGFVVEVIQFRNAFDAQGPAVPGEAGLTLLKSSE